VETGHYRTGRAEPSSSSSSKKAASLDFVLSMMSRWGIDRRGDWCRAQAWHLAVRTTGHNGQHESSFWILPSSSKIAIHSRGCSYNRGGSVEESSGPPVTRQALVPGAGNHRHHTCSYFEITPVCHGSRHWEDKRAVEVVIHQRRGKEEMTLEGRGFGARAASQSLSYVTLSLYSLGTLLISPVHLHVQCLASPVSRRHPPYGRQRTRHALQYPTLPLRLTGPSQSTSPEVPPNHQRPF